MTFNSGQLLQNIVEHPVARTNIIAIHFNSSLYCTIISNPDILQHICMGMNIHNKTIKKWGNNASNMLLMKNKI